MSLIFLDLGRQQSEPSGMDEGWTSAGSVQREKALEHMFLGEISRRMLLATGLGPEILKAEHDSYGYDVVLEAGSVMRHVQLKISRNDGRRAHVDVNVALAAKPGGCVLWMRVDPSNYALGPFGWFGGAPGQPLPDLGDRATRHSKADSAGVKAVRPDQRRVPKGRFTSLDDIDAVIAALFGEPRDRLLRIHLLSRPLDPQASGQPWLAAVRAGFYGAIPRDLEWADTVHLAHLIDGYELTQRAGLGDGFAFADERLERAMRTGAWEGDALELWASIFLEHRRERMSGFPTPSDQQAILRRLVHALLAELQRL